MTLILASARVETRPVHHTVPVEGMQTGGQVLEPARVDHDTVAVEDGAPRGHGGEHRGAVAFSLFLQGFVFHDLQVHQAREYQQEARHHQHLHGEHALPETLDFGLGVAQFGERGQVQRHGQSGRMSSRSTGRRCGASST